MLIIFIIMAVIGYLLGSIPSAVVVSRIMGLPDPREEGSKNPGTTNVLRLGGKKAAAIVLFLDLAKGLIAVVLAKIAGLHHMGPGLVGLAAVIGHIFPIFSGFKGGKGVATAAGVLLALSWPLGIAVIITWIIVAAITRYSSLAALIATGLAPIYSLFLAPAAYQLPILLISAILIWRHYENIMRLMAGEESKIKFK